MLDVIKEMLKSKKAVAAMAGVLVALGAKVGLDLDLDAVMAVLSPILTYIVGQGIADHGKGAALATPPTVTTITN